MPMILLIPYKISPSFDIPDKWVFSVLALSNVAKNLSNISKILARTIFNKYQREHIT